MQQKNSGVWGVLTDGLLQGLKRDLLGQLRLRDAHQKNVMMSMIETLLVPENVCFDVVWFDLTRTFLLESCDASVLLL